MIGLILIAAGLLIFVNSNNSSDPQVKVLSTSDQTSTSAIIVEISGAVQNPGVYSFDANARINDLVNSAGGLSQDADTDWVDKNINRAAPLKDGTKIYIPTSGEQSTSENANISGAVSGDSSYYITPEQNSININTATQSELESLWGIGPVTAKNIIEQRPYSSVEELLSKKILKKNVYEANIDKLSAY